MEHERHSDYEHTGPGTLAGKLLRSFWQPVFVASELAPGQAMPLRIMNEEMTLYRNTEGVARIIAGRCAHRNVLLSVGSVEGDCVRCRYHGWSYDSDGQCVEQPVEKRSFASKIKIRSYPTEEYFGLIWAWMGEGDAPPLPRFPELDGFARIIVLENRKWNYFHDLENTVDDSHQRWVHREGIYQDAGRVDALPDHTAEETSFGLVQTTDFPNGSKRRLYLMMPNMLYFLSGAGTLRGFRSLLWNVPVDDTSHLMFFVFVAAHLPPALGAMICEQIGIGRKILAQDLPPVEEVVQAVLTGKMRWEDIPRRPDVVLIEDGVVLMGQGIIPDRSLNHLGAGDAAIAILRRIYTREMIALDEGRPVGGWAVPEQLPPLPEIPME